MYNYFPARRVESPLDFDVVNFHGASALINTNSTSRGVVKQISRRRGVAYAVASRNETPLSRGVINDGRLRLQRCV